MKPEDLPLLPEETWNDLASLYLAGEASEATRSLIQRRLSADAGFAGKLSAAEQSPPLGSVPAVKPATADPAIAALRRTREYLLLRTIFLAMAIAFSLLPFTVVFRHGAVQFFLWRDLPGAAYGSLGVAAASWSAWYVMHRQVRKVFTRSR